MTIFLLQGLNSRYLMKTKIIVVSLISAIAFTLSGFQVMDNSPIYIAIAKKNTTFGLKQYKKDLSQAVVSCTKCHDCQKDNTSSRDSTKVNNQNDFGNLEATLKKISKSEIGNGPQEKLDWNDSQSPDNFKIR